MRCYATVCKILLCRIFVSDKRQKRDSSHYNSFLLKEKKKRNKLTTPGGTRDKADSWKRCQILSWTLGLLKGLSLSFHPRQCLSQWDKGRCVCKSQSLILWRDPSQLISLVTWAFGGMAWLTPAGVHTLDRNPAAFLSSHGRRDRDVSLQQNFLEGFVFFFFLISLFFCLFETVPVLSSAEKTSSILESLQQSFEEFAVRIIYARGVCRHLQHLFSSFSFLCSDMLD